MVAREDLLEDLLLLVQATQWPNDQTNGSLARNGANRVPKPPRTPHTTPVAVQKQTLARTVSVSRDKSSSNGSDSTDSDDASQEGKKKSCFGLLESINFDLLLPPPEPTLSLEWQAQCDQVSSPSHTSPPYQYSVHSPPRLSHQVQSPARCRSPDASTKKNKASPDFDRVLLYRHLSTKTQEVVQLLLCEVFELSEEDLHKIILNITKRKSADVTLELSMDSIGEDSEVQGNLRLLGGKNAHVRELKPPLPTSYTTHMPVDNLWSQQLLVRFSRDKKIILEPSKNYKKAKNKKIKKLKDGDEDNKNNNHESEMSASGPQVFDITSTSLDVSTSRAAVSDMSATVSHRSPSLNISTSSIQNTSTTKGLTLQRGLKSIRQSLKRKKHKKKESSLIDVNVKDHLNSEGSVKSGISGHLDGIPVENVSTPISTPAKRPTDDFNIIERNSKSPFHRFGSLALKKPADASMKSLNKLRSSFRKGVASTYKIAIGKSDKSSIDSDPSDLVVHCKEELVTKSARPTKAFAYKSKDLINEEFDKTNPFATINEIKCEDDETNSLLVVNRTDLNSHNKSKSKSLRKSVRKTFSRIGSMRKGKKDKNLHNEDVELKIPSKIAASEARTEEELKNLINAGSLSPIKSINLTREIEAETSKIELKSNETPAKFQIITEELAFKIFHLQETASQAPLEETLTLLEHLRIVVKLKLSINFQTKCSPFDMYRLTYQALYRRRFRELVPMKSPYEGVDCNATADGEVLLRQISVFCPMTIYHIALARFLVLVEAVTGRMGTPNTINAAINKAKKKRPAPKPPGDSLVVEVHQEDSINGPINGVDETMQSSNRSSNGSTQSSHDKSCRSPSTQNYSQTTSDHADNDEDVFVYNQKSETILIAPSDVLGLLEKVAQGLSQGVFTKPQTNEALLNGLELVRWVVAHHLERLQTVFPVSGGTITSKNLAYTLKCLVRIESCEVFREYFESEMSELGLGGVRDHVTGAVRKYTQLWVAALIRETNHRIDRAMSDQLKTAAETNVLQTATSQGNGAYTLRSPSPACDAKSTSASSDNLSDDPLSKLSFSATGVVEAVPALLTSFVRTVKQFENNKQIVYLADLVEKRLGTYRPMVAGISSNVAVPMIGYQRDSFAETPNEDDIAEIVLRLDVVGKLMPVIVDFLDIAKGFYNPIFLEHYQMAFLDESWQVMVDGALLLWRQIGAGESLRATLMEPPLKSELIRPAISAVWSLCYSFSCINRLGDSCTSGSLQCSRCMDDCVTCWLQLITHQSQQKLHRGVAKMTSNTQLSMLEDLTRDMQDIVKLVVSKAQSLCWPGKKFPKEVLNFLGCQLTAMLDTFWRTLYLSYRDPGKRPNVISYWSCRIMDSLSVLSEEITEALEQLDLERDAVVDPLNSLQLMPQKAAQLMCLQELTNVEDWVAMAVSGQGGGALVQKLDEALRELYECLMPAQPLVACLRDRLLDATAKHLDDVTQEEEFSQLVAVLQALQQFFTSSILHAEALQVAESRWAQQLEEAKERGLPFAELQQRYYDLRYDEQLIFDEPLFPSNSILVNIVFIEKSGLSVSIVQVPSAVSILKTTVSNQPAADPAKNASAAGGASKLAPKSTGMFSNVFKSASNTGGVYVKAQLVPIEWFPECSSDLKTSVCKDESGVIDEEIQFPRIQKTSSGVEKGGFLLLRLKLTRRLRSHTVGETLVPLSTVQQVPIEERRSARHQQLPYTKAGPLHDYKPLNILRRRNDEVSSQFLVQLEQDNKVHQKAIMKGSNASLSSLW